MATAVVSGRVDVRVRDRANRVIRAAGLSTADVIKGVWTSIAQTGTLPDAFLAGRAQDSADGRLEDFLDFVDSLPPAPAELANMTDEEMACLLGSRDA